MYQDKARYCIILVSQSYAKKLWTRHELKQAQTRAFRESREYILPLRLDDTEIPGLNHTVGYIDLRITDLNAVCDLVIEKIYSDDPNNAETEIRKGQMVEYNDVEKASFGESIIASVVGVARTKVHRLLVFWIQLVLSNFVFSAIGGEWVGGILVFSMLLVFAFSIAISRLVNRNIVMSVLIGGLVIGMLEGGLAYVVRDWAVKVGILYGFFYGASLTRYFSDKEKQTNLFWAVISTSFLIAVLVILECSIHDFVHCLWLIGHYIGDSLKGAVMTIILGLALSPVITPLTRFIESFVEAVADLDRTKQ